MKRPGHSKAVSNVSEYGLETGVRPRSFAIKVARPRAVEP